MLNEVTLALIAPLEQMGYTLPADKLPDGSLGKVFSRYLREKGVDVDSFPKYPHEFEDGRTVDVRAYPNSFIAELRKFFVEEWMLHKSKKYFAERDPKAIPFLEKMLALPNLQEAMGYIEAPN